MRDSKKTSTAKTAKNTARINRWKPGQSGNPQGRPEGSRNKASIAVENLFLDEQERLSRKCIKLALRGNMQALKLCIERNLPCQKKYPYKRQFAPYNES